MNKSMSNLNKIYSILEAPTALAVICHNISMQSLFLISNTLLLYLYSLLLRLNGQEHYQIRLLDSYDQGSPKYHVSQLQAQVRMRCLGHAAGVSSQPIHVQLGLDLESCLARALLRNNLNECFRKCRIKRSKGILQQDGATCHTAKIIGKYLILVAEPGQH